MQKNISLVAVDVAALKFVGDDRLTTGRVIEVLITMFLLVLLGPVLLLLALATRLDSAGPVIYRQVRVGLRGQHFTIYKIRSMRCDAERHNAPVWASAHDPRSTSLGSLLRSTHLDELPQLVNILRGEMSFIGPRPERPHFVELLKQELPDYALRLAVKPGLTGLAQVALPNYPSIDNSREKLKLDLQYIATRSLYGDVSIVLRTVFLCLVRIPVQLCHDKINRARETGRWMRRLGSQRSAGR